MNFASSISKHLFIPPILVVVAIQLLFLRSVSSLNVTNLYLHHKCSDKYGKYEPGSEHEKFLNKIIHGFSKHKDNFRIGYGKMSLGNEPDKVTVTFQCRGDSYGPKCQSCFATAQSELKRRCPRDKRGIIWYDQCFLEFSPIDTYEKPDRDDTYCIPSVKNTSHNYYVEWGYTSINLTTIMLDKNSSDHYYAAGQRTYQKRTTYAMHQCVRDLTLDDCHECLAIATVYTAKCYAYKQGVRGFVGKSCNFRFELYPFISPTSPNYHKLYKS